jgi:hypothetical protein
MFMSAGSLEITMQNCHQINVVIVKKNYKYRERKIPPQIIDI